MKTISEIAGRLVSLLKEQKFVDAYRELFSDDALSIDPIYADQPPLKGLDLLVEREGQFLQRAQIHAIEVSDALIAGNYFTISLKMDFTAAGERKNLGELCVYKIKQGKIVSQQFFIGI
jgi:hypothetical protein